MYLESFYRHNYWSNTIKFELMNETGTGDLQSFKVNARPSLLVVSYAF